MIRMRDYAQIAAINTEKTMNDKNGTLLAVDDLVISTYRESAGKIYRIKSIGLNADPTEWQISDGRLHQALCVAVYDRFLDDKKLGNFTTTGWNVVKVDKKLAKEMAKKWAALAKQVV